jgi:hypothetical protein
VSSRGIRGQKKEFEVSVRFVFHFKCEDIEPIIKEKGEELRAEQLF